MELGIQGWGVVCWLRQPLWATDGSSAGAGEVCIYTFPWKEGTQLPVRLLVSAAAPVASGSPPLCGSDGCWGLGHLLQPLPDHQPEHGVLAHQLLDFPIFFLLELLNKAFKDRHLELYVLGHVIGDFLHLVLLHKKHFGDLLTWSLEDSGNQRVIGVLQLLFL